MYNSGKLFELDKMFCKLWYLYVLEMSIVQMYLRTQTIIFGPC